MAAAGAVVLGLAVVSPSGAEDVCGVNWDGGAASTRWQDATNWSGDQQPGPGDVVCIPAGSSVRHELGNTSVEAVRGEGVLTVRGGVLRLSGPSSIGRLSVEGGFTANDAEFEIDVLAQSAGALLGDGTVTTRELAWSGGTQDGGGTTVVTESGSITGGGHSLTTSRSLELRPGSVVTWDGGDLELRDSAELVNAGAFEIRGDQDFTGCCPGGAIANRPGATIRKTAGGGDTHVSYALRNEGAIEVAAGTLTLHGGVDSSGAIDVADAATVRFPAGITALRDGSRTTAAGTGRLLYTGGTVDVEGAYEARTVVDGPGARVSFEAAATAARIEMRRGFLMGDGSISTPDLAWSGGSLGGSGATTVVPGGPGLVVSGSGQRELSRRTLTVEHGANARVTEGILYLSDRGRLENDGRLELLDDTRLDLCCDSTPVVHNRAGGVVEKRGSSRASITPAFTNDGTVEADEGTLAFSNALSNLQDGRLAGGTWHVAATLEMRGPIVRNAARLTLDGPASTVWDAAARNDALRELEANESPGELTLENGRELAVPAILTNSGAVRIASDSSLAAATRYVQDDGTTTLTSAGSRLGSGAGPADVQGGVLSGIGTVTGGLVNAGEVRPGLSPGTLKVSGDYDQRAAGTLEIEIGGRAAEERDLLDVSGAARFAGTLRVETLAPFLPEPIDGFEIVRHTSVAGAFDSAEGLQVDETHGYHPPDYEPAGTWLRSSTAPRISVGDVTVDEGAGEAAFEVRLSSPVRRRTGAIAMTADGTAVEPDDYTRTTSAVAIEPGETVGRFTVPIADDALDEPDETFTVQLAETYPGDLTATATIVDDDEPAPDPEPDPDPGPDPGPDPDPDPTPDPDPEPTPDPDPDPTPGPDPDPDPDPRPDPGPEPTPDPEPGPTPDPDPFPLPWPAPSRESDPPPAPFGDARVADLPPAPEPAPAAELPATRCTDRTPPRSSFRPNRQPVGIGRGALRFAGIAWDRGCGKKLDRVTVAIARRQGGGTGLCRYLQPSGRLGRTVSCRRPTYVRARGTSRWSFRASGGFPPGTWTARIRAVDRAGNAEKKVRKPAPLSRNFITFKIR